MSVPSHGKMRTSFLSPTRIARQPRYPLAYRDAPSLVSLPLADPPDGHRERIFHFPRYTAESASIASYRAMAMSNPAVKTDLMHEKSFVSGIARTTDRHGKGKRSSTRPRQNMGHMVAPHAICRKQALDFSIHQRSYYMTQ